MKHAILPFIAILLCMGCKESKPKNEDASSAHAIPRLEAVFGKLIEIEGDIVDYRDTLKKAHRGKKLISINVVGDRKLAAPIVMELDVFSFISIDLPERGGRVKLRGYETGGYSGIPDEAFEDIPRVATTAHHFKSYFQITKLLKQQQTQQVVAGNPLVAPESKN